MQILSIPEKLHKLFGFTKTVLFEHEIVGTLVFWAEQSLAIFFMPARGCSFRARLVFVEGDPVPGTRFTDVLLSCGSPDVLDGGVVQWFRTT